MLIVYDPATGDVLDNTGTNSLHPTGPPDDLALVNTPADRHAAVQLLRLHDDDDAEQVALALSRLVRVEGGHLVDAGPFPESEPVEPSPSLDDRLAAVEARLDKAASAVVTGDAAKLRDNLR